MHGMHNMYMRENELHQVAKKKLRAAHILSMVVFKGILISYGVLYGLFPLNKRPFRRACVYVCIFADARVFKGALYGF